MTKQAFSSPAEIIAAIDEIKREHGARWTLTNLADYLNVSTKTIQRYRAKWATVADALEEAKDRRDDWAESCLFRLMEEGNPAAVIFYAKTQMRHRGYIERTEIANATAEDGEPIPFRIVDYRAGFAETEG